MTDTIIRSSRGKGIVAVAGNLLCPGAGHFIAGQYYRALFWFLLSICVNSLIFVLMLYPTLHVSLIILVPAGVVVTLLCYIDAFFSGRRSSSHIIRSAAIRYITGLLLIAASVWINPALRFARYYRNHFVEAYSVLTPTMLPTIAPGDHILCSKRMNWGRWDLVVAETPVERIPFARRVIGLPGETIEIINNRVTINGQTVEPPAGVGPYVSTAYIGNKNPSLAGKPGAGCEGNPIHLSDDEYFVIGDNSRQCLDARHWEIPVPGHQLGAIPKDYIKGRITTIYWPVNRWGVFK